MRTIIFLMAIIQGQAMAAKIVFIDTNGKQHLTEVFEGGSIGKEAKIIWDERVDGTIPRADDYEVVDVTAENGVKKLVVSAEKTSAKASRLQVEADARAQKKLRRDAVLEIKTKIKNGTASKEEVNSAVEYLLERI